MSLSEAWKKVETAVKENHFHIKRKKRLSEYDIRDIFMRATEELGELSQAMTRDGNEMEEMADLFAVLMHLSMRLGFTEKQLSDMIAEKLNKRLAKENEYGKLPEKTDWDEYILRFRNGQMKVEKWNFCISGGSNPKDKCHAYIMGTGAEQCLASQAFSTRDVAETLFRSLGVKRILSI